MINWEDLTDAQKDELNDEAFDACVGMLRDADAQFPGCDLDDLRDYCSRLIAADMAENARLIRRAERARATQADKRAADAARSHNFHLGLRQGFIWDAEF